MSHFVRLAIEFNMHFRGARLLAALTLLAFFAVMPRDLATTRAFAPKPASSKAIDFTDPSYWRKALEQPHADGEILVAYPPAVFSAPTLKRPERLAKAQTIETIPSLNMVRYRVATDMAPLLAALNADPNIEFAEPNYLLFPSFSPNDPYYIQYAANDSIAGGGYLNRINIEQAWDMTRGAPNIIVAIIDSGIALDHEDIADGLWQNPGEIPDNGLDDDGNGLVDDVYGWNFAAESPNVDDWHGHGSHVAGIVAARMNNGRGIAGIAPKTKVMAVGVFSPPGFGTFADEVEAILYATDMGASVINLSLGSTAYSLGEQRAVEYAVRHGVVVVAAAGNNGREIHHWPAAHEAAIAVAATTATDQRASYSNMGDYIDVAAPGSSIWSLNRWGGYVANSGTSMAAPHVAGLAALVLARNPTLAPAEVRAIIENSATDLGAQGWDKAFGHGRIDAQAALEAVPPYQGEIPPRMPDWLRAQVWPPLCTERVASGGFENGANESWTLTGTAAFTDTVAAEGKRSLFLAGAPAAQGDAFQIVSLPADLNAATLAFALRAENDDRDLGDDPAAPGRDFLRAWLRTRDGEPLLELLRAGNANFNLATGLPWDRYLHVFSADELTLLREHEEIQIWFYADNGPDPAITRFFVDDVRFCTSGRPLYLPLTLQE
ncbi:MAG: S8 family serine peptidase [Chloroflexi bacterium]|nr:S8 family serine peptidase [Chloroflexota bacterium]